MQVVHNCCCQHNFIQQLKLEKLIKKENRYTHPYACLHVEQFSFFYFSSLDLLQTIPHQCFNSCSGASKGISIWVNLLALQLKFYTKRTSKETKNCLEKTLKVDLRIHARSLRTIPRTMDIVLIYWHCILKCKYHMLCLPYFVETYEEQPLGKI